MNIWESIEAEAWARGFTYSGYMHLHADQENIGSMLTEQGYATFCQLMEDEMRESLK